MTGSQARVDAALLAQVLALVGTQTDEVTVTPSDDGWSLIARSADLVTMTSVRICTPAITTSIGAPFAIGIPAWQQALRGQGEAVIDVSSGRAVVTVGEVTSTLPLYPDTTPPREPQLDLPAGAYVPVSSVRRLVDVTDPKGPVGYRFSIGPSGLTIASHDEAGMGTAVRVPEDVCVPEGAAQAVYPWKPWAAFVKALPRDTVLHVTMASDYPLRVDVDLADGVTAWWMVAPFIESE